MNFQLATPHVIGLGGGLFKKPVVYTVPGSTPWNIITTDFNGDGRLDLAVGFTNSLVILLGAGDGTFQLAPTQPSVAAAYFVAAADFNHDGKADLAVTDPNAGVVHILLGNGNGTFTAHGSFPAGSQALGVVSADVNGDRVPDLVVAGNTSVSVLVGKGGIRLGYGRAALYAQYACRGRYRDFAKMAARHMSTPCLRPKAILTRSP